MFNLWTPHKHATCEHAPIPTHTHTFWLDFRNVCMRLVLFHCLCCRKYVQRRILTNVIQNFLSMLASQNTVPHAHTSFTSIIKEGEEKEVNPRLMGPSGMREALGVELWMFVMESSSPTKGHGTELSSRGTAALLINELLRGRLFSSLSSLNDSVEH